MTPNPYSGPSYKGLSIGLLGGSFNPAHTGHMAMSLHALKRLGLDQVWWLVSPQNPLKDKADMAGIAERARSADAVVKGHPAIHILTIEARLGTRYSIDTLRLLKRRFPATRFVWLMGADNWQSLPRWKKWDALVCEAPIAVFRRPGYAAGRCIGKPSLRFATAFHGATEAGNLAAMRAPAWLVLDNKLNPLSATQLRRQRK
jgi:nicotinate-nucleotide adenylyltransferase